MLQDKIVLVTGASRGLGHTVALKAGMAGAQVIAIARTQGALEALDDQLRDAGKSCTLLLMNLTKGEEIDRLGPSIYQRFGRLDALIHCAGELGPLTPTHQLKPKDLERLIALTALSTHRLIGTLDPLLRAAPSSHAIFIDDELAQTPRPFWSAYQAGKAAMRAIVDNYALENAQSTIQIHRITPEPMQTVLRRQAFPGEPDNANPSPDAQAERILAYLGKMT